MFKISDVALKAGKEIYMLYYVSADEREARPPRLYRSIEEISRDIGRIKNDLYESETMLNVRGLLTEFICDLDSGDEVRWQSSLERLICEAEEAIRTLNRLQSKLDMLNRELEEARCHIRRR